MKRGTLNLSSLVRRQFARLGLLADLPLQRWLLSKNTVASPPILIMGPARSGTTLVYQLLATSPDIAFINGPVADHPYTPTIAAIRQKRDRPEVGNFSSTYGVSADYRGPQQGQSLWGRWLKPGRRARKGALRAMSRTVAAQSAIYQRPMVLKWPGFVAHTDEVLATWPDALYVFISRDIASNARSLLVGNSALRGDAGDLITRTPLSFKADSEGPAARVISYLEATHAECELLRAKLDSGQVVSVMYTDVCNNPKLIAETIFSSFKRWTGTAITLGDAIPSQFTASAGPALPADLEVGLQAELRKPRRW